MADVFGMHGSGSVPRRINLDIAGLRGFPALSSFGLFVNYRDGLVRTDSR
jgi:hypothetical protein